MKKIKISDGEIRNGYEFKDLSETAKTRCLLEQIEFEIQIMDEESPYYEVCQKMERMRTPWFLADELFHNHQESLIETIEVNEYLFDEDGEMLPVTYQFENEKLIKTSFKNKDCEIENV